MCPHCPARTGRLSYQSSGQCCFPTACRLALQRGSTTRLKLAQLHLAQAVLRLTHTAVHGIRGAAGAEQGGAKKSAACAGWGGAFLGAFGAKKHSPLL
eukprot:2026732-Rhodomonas_salina.4